MNDLYDNLDNPKQKRRDSYMSYDSDDIGMEERDKLKDKVTHLQNFLSIFQKRMEGYEFVSALDKVTYTGRVLAGKEVIQKMVSLLSPFSENTNMIGEGKIDDYYRKKHRIHSVVNSILLTDISISPENYNTIMESFKNTFVNIGNVVNSSKGLLKSQFVGEERIITNEGDY